MEDYNNSPWIRSDLDRWAVLCKPGYIITVHKGEFLFAQGEKSCHIYLIRTGRVLLSALSQKGTERILMFATRGGILGEQALSDHPNQPYTARTVSDCSIYKIPLLDFQKELALHQELWKLLMEVMLAKERALIAHVADLLFQDAYHRTVHELLFCAEAHGTPCPEGVLIGIPISQEQLANRIQVSRITINKVLKRLTQAQLVGRRGQNFILLDLGKLKAIDRLAR